ncbi:MAG: carboxypeptidase-like regulatory domain-containing protein [Acidobacteriota bacterium]|nr:carboxypeptidase-like regulatory domain-containing protein [Acidobacteriota bacterium]
MMKLCTTAILVALALAAQPRRPAPRPDTSATATEPPAPAPVSPEDQCTLDGNVLNASTGEPLRKAHLLLQRQGDMQSNSYSTVTDNAGHFVMDHVDPGRYMLSASRNGFVSQQYSPQGTPRRGATISLERAQNLSQIRFRLTPEGVITGRVLDQDGDPMPNIMVQVLRFSYARGRKQLMPANSEQTNDLGEYRLHDLAPGKYFIGATWHAQQNPMQGNVISTGPAAARAAAEEGYAQTFYPNTANPEAASTLEVTPGAVIRGIDISLLQTRTVRVSGRVVSSLTSRPIKNVNVFVMRRDNPYQMMRLGARVIDPSGAFTVRGVVPGSYFLQADSFDEGKRLTARMPIEVGSGNLENLQVSVGPAAEITGRIVYEGSNTSDSKPGTVRVMLEAKTADPMGGAAGSMTKEDNTFTIQNVTANAYNVGIYGLNGNWYLKSVRLGDADITETGVDFAQGVTPAELVVSLSSDGGQLEGTVQDAKQAPAVGAQVILIPELSRRGMSYLYKQASTDQTGHYSMKGIRPGKYTVIAWEQVDQGAYMDPDFLKPFESKGESVTIGENGQEKAQLKAIPSDAETPTAR